MNKVIDARPPVRKVILPGKCGLETHGTGGIFLNFWLSFP